MPDLPKVFIWLLRLYPARFREEYQVELARQFRDEYRDSETRLDKARLWLRSLADLLMSAPRELLRECSMDLRHAVRVYRHRMPTAISAVVALGLAIGLSTGIFSVLNALLFRALPFKAADELVELWQSPFNAMNGRKAFLDWSSSSGYLQDSATFSVTDMNLRVQAEAGRVTVSETSANFFRLLGTPVVAGSGFAQREDQPGHPAVAVIGYGLWQQLFAGDRAAIGRTIHLNGFPVTVIGVAPPAFDYPQKTAVWMPSAFDIELVPKQGVTVYRTIGRLWSGVSLPVAREQYAADVQRRLPGHDREHYAGLNKPDLLSMRSQLARSIQSSTWVLAAIILLVLVAACANVAQLLLSRVSERQNEIAIRRALGASQARLVQQLATEATLLTMSGAALGLFIAYWSAHLIASIVPPELASQQYRLFDWPVILFAVALAAFVSLLFGLLPSRLVAQRQFTDSAVRSQREGETARAKRTRSLLIAIQAALTVCLLTTSITMQQTLMRLFHDDLGFRTDHVVTLNVSLQGSRHQQGAQRWQYYNEALRRLRAVKGVGKAAAITYLPIATPSYMASSFRLANGQTVEGVIVNATTPGYFAVMGSNLVRGQDFKAGWNNSQRVIIVNEAFAKASGLGTRIVGQRITNPWNRTPSEVIGVMQSEKLSGPGTETLPQIFWPIEEEPPAALSLVATVEGDAANYLERCKAAVRGVDPQVPVYDVRTLGDRVAMTLARPKFFATASSVLTLLATLLAVIGIYGKVAFSVAQRHRETGVRMALGAPHKQLRAMVVKENVFAIAAGIVFGLMLASVIGKFLSHLVTNADVPSAAICVVSAALLLAVAMLTAWLATNRVLRIDPMEAVRAG